MGDTNAVKDRPVNGVAEGTEEVDLAEGTTQEVTVKDETGLFEEEQKDEEKVIKWRFLAKGPALAALLAFFGARAVEGDKQVGFKVKSAGDRELGDVVRALFLRAERAGVTLADLIKVIREKESKAKG